MSSPNHPDPQPSGLGRRIWRSILRRPLPRDERERAWFAFNTLLLHFRPPKLPERSLRWGHTMGLGGSGLVLLTLLAGTGILMMLVYQPTPDVAYDSLLAIEGQVAFGSLVRGVHHWSANLLIVVLALHAARVFLTGGWHGPRQFNWVIGCGLAAAVLASAFSGYLLPWDQRAYWAVTISTGMLEYLPWVGAGLRRVVLGGDELGASTLTSFYTLHTTIVPVLVLGLAALHFWRVRKAGGVVLPPPAPDEPEGRPEKVAFLPALFVRELSQALVLSALVALLAVLLGAPLGERANPAMSPNPAKAPWYFMGIQELLIHLHPVVALAALPLGAAAALLLLPYLGSDGEPTGRWWLSGRGRRLALGAAALALALTPLAVLASERLGQRAGWFASGALPLCGIAALSVGGWWLLRRRQAASLNESLQTLVVFYAVAFATLTAIGVWFRGAGMALTWPWSG